ncbi:MAG: PDZ domain-containing protein [Chloroflexi bacterium]|nr:PDZ domain-containing protein [Chloroflexota bacterium]
MKSRRIVLAVLVAWMLSCQTINRMIATPTPLPTFTPIPTFTFTPTPEPLKPAYIPPECAAVPLATAIPNAQAESTPEVEPNPELSTTEQLDVFNELTDIVSKVYVYPDFNGRNWNEIQSRYEAQVNAGLDTESFYRAMSEMIFELGDEHSFFLSPSEVKQSNAELEGNVEFVGVGIYGQTDLERGRHIVISTFPGSAADQSGIQPHDAILKVDGVPVTEGSGFNLRGPKCSAVVMTVQSPGGEPRDVMLVRHNVQGGLDIDARLVPTTDGSKIGYIFIPSFFDETIPPQIERALEEFGILDGLILDVRVNGGGSSGVVDPIFAHFVSGRLGQFVTREESRPYRIEADPIANSQTVPLVVVVSEDTASYGEIFAGVLRDQGRAKVTGEDSLGNVEVLYGFTFDDGSQVWIASATFRPENSSENWEETGIVTDLPAFAPWDTFIFETDPSIAAALTLLGHQ